MGLHPPSVWMTTTSSLIESALLCLAQKAYGTGADAVEGEELVEIRREMCKRAVTRRR